MLIAKLFFVALSLLVQARIFSRSEAAAPPPLAAATEAAPPDSSMAAAR
jgi:hypothetical protein